MLIASVPIALSVLASQTPREDGRAIEPMWRAFAFGAAEWYPWVLVAPVIDWLVRRSRPVTARDRILAFVRHARTLALFAVAHALVNAGAQALIEGPVSLSGVFTRISRILLPDAILYAAIASGFAIAESRRRQTEVAERLRGEVAQARLDALRQQLNPHFLFNTLNHIVTEVRSRNYEPAEQMLLALSDLLRDVLRERAQLIPLRDEVRMVERYLEIERARFGARLQAEVSLEPRALDALVPSLLLQPLLENAMRHGVSSIDGRCVVSVQARLVRNRLVIDVRDAGPGIDLATASPSGGVGLTNTRERLGYLYGADHRFELVTLDSGGLLVSIDVPFRKA
jgi:sensor histidine kinase YesM